MSCTCNEAYVNVVSGNSFILQLHVAQYDAELHKNIEYPMDNATNVAVRLIGNNGKCIKYTDIDIDGSTLSFLVDGQRLKPAKYGIELTFQSGDFRKRAYRCGLLNVVNCGSCVDNSQLGNHEIDIIFNEDNEIINIGGVVWAAVDDHLDKNSQNPVANSVITNTLTNDYATKDYVLEVVSGGEIDTDDFVKDDELVDILSSYVKTDVLDETLNSYVKSDTLNETLSSYVTNQQMQDAIDAIPETDLSDYYTKSEIDDKIDAIPQPDLSSYATTEYVDNAIDNIPETDLSDYYTKEQVDDKIDAIPQPDLSNYYTKSEIDDKFDNIDIPDVDMSSYVTKTQLADSHFAYSYQVSDLTQELIDDEKVIATHGNKIENLTSYFSSYATIDYVDEQIAEAISGGDIDLSAYVTKEYLSQQSYAYNSTLSDYTTLTQFNESVNNLQSQIDNIEPSTDVDLSAYVKKTELDANDYAYKADLNDYYTKTQVDDIVDNLQPEIDLSSYVTWDFLSQQSYITADYLSSQSYATSAELNNLTDDVIDDELVLARAVNDINKVASYLNSYVKISDYNELVNSYNRLYLTVTYLMQNVQWADDSGSQEDFTAGYIIGTATQSFNTVGCQALPSTYFSAPSFKVAVPNGKLTGNAAKLFSTNPGGSGNSYITSITSFDVDTSEVTDMRSMFEACLNLTSLDLSGVDTSNVTNMRSMFEFCGLTSLDLSSFNTSRVTDMCEMFSWCTKLTSLDLSSFDTSNVTNMKYMFEYCDELASLDLSSFNTSNVITMACMFYDCSKLTSLDLSHFNTSNVASMSRMFYSCDNLTSLDLSSFNTSKVTDMQYMFFLCEHLKSLDLSSFNTSRVTDMSGMFSFCRQLTTLDISNFNLVNVTDMADMFSNCGSLMTIYVNNMTTANINKIKTQLETNIGTFTLSTVNGRKALVRQ